MSSWKYEPDGVVFRVSDPAASLEPYQELIRHIERPLLQGPCRAEVLADLSRLLADNMDASSWDYVGGVEISFLREDVSISEPATLCQRHIDDLRDGDLHPISKAAVLAYSEYRRPHRTWAYANQARKGFPGVSLPLTQENAVVLGLLLPRHDDIMVKLRWKPGVLSPT